jgi:Ser/Thr protein kinase RdoA (MazF antagonist)
MIHCGMQCASANKLLYIPEVYRNRNDNTFSTDGKSLWELTQWMPGTADYLEQPSDRRLQAAMQSLAKLHLAWASAAQSTMASPTVSDRVQRLSNWLTTNHSQPLAPRNALEDALVSDTRSRLMRQGPELLRQLKALAKFHVPIHFVIRDIWSDHVLFVDEQVSGIIDFGAARQDEPATDVARLLGSLEPFDDDRWQQGMNAYLQVNSGVVAERVQVLDRVATLLSALQWMQWLIVERRSFAAPIEQLYARWQRLLARR